MAHLIDKDAVVAEIERRIESCAKQREDMLNVQCHTLADDASARMGELNCIKDFLVTLEAKEVDLDNFIKEEFNKYSCVDGYGQLSVSYNMAEFYGMIKRLTKAQKGNVHEI